MLEFTAALDILLDENGRAAGAVVFNMETEEYFVIRSKAVESRPPSSMNRTASKSRFSMYLLLRVPMDMRSDSMIGMPLPRTVASVREKPATEYLVKTSPPKGIVSLRRSTV